MTKMFTDLRNQKLDWDPIIEQITLILQVEIDVVSLTPPS